MTRSTRTITILCWLAALLDGFDLVVLGTVLPHMLEDPSWHLSGADATQVTTSGLVGMTIGAITIGAITDRWGRRRVLITAVFLFSLFTLPLALHPGVGWFIALRFLAGLGLGGALPIGMALVTEFRGGARAGSASTTLMTGYHVGAVLTAVLALYLIAHFGWASMFLIGGVAGLLLVPFLVWRLPESPHYLLNQGRTEEAHRIAEQWGLSLHDEFDEREKAAHADAESGSVRTLLSPRYRRNTLAIWGTSFMGLLLVYGLNTWLPQIMRAADYPMGDSLGFLLVLNVGAVVGLLLAGALADRVTPRLAALLWFVASAVFLALLAVKMPMLILYLAVFITGVFVFSSQVLIYAFTAANHPSTVRATAMGLSAGVGRLGAICGPILAGTLAGAGHAYPWGFFAFAAVGALGALIFATSRTLRTTTTVLAAQPA
ncbi:MFS transporter [Corynebacterium uropygiale]|uniref:MFS transporter n=1 Tax=Corynebacterium uropygiale TaxID=1775911 RepID=A0A9X1U866_9CORY|nr:aromatic acid/H+ symport family MFS transporter [Corynebacterium uropygiale]MCF4007492.1 MFS transporter [Corynebacterium uropygiale]